MDSFQSKFNLITNRLNFFIFFFLETNLERSGYCNKAMAEARCTEYWRELQVGGRQLRRRHWNMNYKWFPLTHNCLCSGPCKTIIIAPFMKTSILSRKKISIMHAMYSQFRFKYLKDQVYLISLSFIDIV